MAKQQPVKSRARADLPFTPPVWPATNPEMRRIADIHEYPKNPRKHPPDQIAMLARLMKQHGVDQPIVLDEDGVILKGHGRRLAAIAAGFDEFPVVVHRGLSEVDKTAMRIQDNQVSILAGWDTQLMGGAIAELRSSGYEVALLGFPESQLRSFGPGIGDPQPDVVPIPPKAPVVRVGDLWVLGKHRVLCGDSTRVENWKRLFGQERASLVFTDPPYGVSYQAQSGAFGVIEGDKKRRDELYKMLLKAIGNLVDHAHDKAAFYIWHASETREDFAQAMKAAGLAERQYILWVKPAIVLGHADYQWQHEPCQPAGTMVDRVVAKGVGRGRPAQIESVPIETLQEGDRLVSYDPHAAKILRRGRKIVRFGSRRYEGNMHTVDVGGEKKTRATADHRFTVRMDPKAAGKHVVYLMRRGDWWRVGVVKVFNSRGFALGVRLTDERADAAWIIAVCDDHLSARVTEQATSCLYGIPTTHWETSKRPNITSIRSKDHIGQIYAQVGIGFIDEGARRLLDSRGLKIEDPIVAKGEREPTSRKKARLMRARNLVPGIMQLPVPTTGERFEWRTISGAQFEHYDGTVYSMDVEAKQHYIADGIVTHNCFYAAKAGASPAFYADRGESTVWHVQLTASKDTAATIGNGIVLLDGQGRSLFIQARAPKNKKLRHIRVAKDSNVFLSGADRQDSTVWEVARDGQHEHPTQKPVELARRAIENSSQNGEIVADAFLGSGTTLIGCEMTARRCYGMELDPVYAEVIVRRWERLTGQKASLGGRTLEQVAKARREGRPAEPQAGREHPKRNGAAQVAAPSRKRTVGPPGA